MTTRKTVQMREKAGAAADDLLWLEAPHEKRALAWAREHTQSCCDRLQALPSLRAVKAELEETLERATPEPHIQMLGHRALRLLVTALHPFGELQVAERDAGGAPQAWRTVFDVGALRERSGIPYVLQAWDLESAFLPPDFGRGLLHLSHGGGDEAETREFDLDRGEFVEGGFYVPKSLARIQWLNRDLLLVGQTFTGPRTVAGHPIAFQLWRRGEPLQSARVIYQGEPTDMLINPYAAGEGAHRYGVISRSVDAVTFEIHLVYQDGGIERVPLPSDTLKSSAMVATLAAGSKAIFVQLSRDLEVAGRQCAAGTLLAYAVDRSVPATQRFNAVYTPNEGEFLYGPGLSGVVATRDQVAFIVNRRLVPKVMVAEPAAAGWAVRELLRMEPGESVSTLAADVNGSDLIVTSCGFMTPSRQVLYRSAGKPRLLAQDPVRFSGAGNYITEIGSATSKDGTQVDYYLLRPRASAHKGLQPLLLTGYAAYGISTAPDYFGDEVGGPAFKLWVDRGGSLVIPAARGGLERGDAWHRAAMGEHRQRSYDDFIAVLEKLVETGFTAPGRIGVFGASNGGLMAAVLATQRPDLFGAAVSDVPLTDMLRMKYMGKGASWLGEYGDAADPRMAQALASYSPLQNVRSGVKYPPFFISVSTEDDRVGPGHARKLAARLEEIGSPVYFYEKTEGGHGVSDAYRSRELMALRIAFLIDNLMNLAR